MPRRIPILGWAAVLMWAAAAPAAEPANLSLLKQEIRTYVESGEYLREVAQTAARAKAWIDRRAAARTPAMATAEGKMAVVFDLDETLLANAAEMMERDFSYDPAAWDAWVAAASAPALEPVRGIYQHARSTGVAVIIITGRPERQRAATERNLRAIGCADYAALVCAPDDGKTAIGAFKLEERRRLAQQGYVIIANIGDQQSDFFGGGAERDFKLPNPFYLTP